MNKWNYRTLLLFCTLFAGIACAAAVAQQPTDICTDNETWIPAGTLPGPVVAATAGTDALYAVHYLVPNPQFPATSFRLSRWDGKDWSTLNDFTAFTFGGGRDSLSGESLTEIDGELFLVGNFRAWDNPITPAREAVTRWDGTQWHSATSGLPTGNALNVTKVKKIDGRMYLLNGLYNDARVYVWNGTSWDPATGQLVASYVVDFTVFNGEVVISTFSPQPNNIVRWDGTNWVGLGGAAPGLNPSVLLVFDGGLCAIGDASSADISLYRYDGTNWNAVGGQAFASSGGAMSLGCTVFDGRIYLSGETWNDNQRMMQPYIARFDGAKWEDVSNFDAGVNPLVVFNGGLYALGSFTRSCGQGLSYAAYMCNEKTCGTVSGIVYRDDNDNCTLDGAEYGLNRHMVEVQPGGHHAFTDNNGAYSLFLPTGSYTVSMVPYPRWATNCPSAGSHSVTLATIGQSSGGNDFGMKALSTVPDLRVSIGATNRARQGRPLNYSLMYENIGTVTATGTLRVTLDPMVRFDSASPAPSRMNGSTPEWDFQNLGVGEARTIKLWSTISMNAQRGTILCTQSEVLVIGDDELWNNRDSSCIEVTGSYDPNDMTVFPVGLDGDQLGAEDSVLTYMVRFQNTGNDTAFEVVVIDTLSQHLDITTLKLGATSHPYTLTIGKNSTLIWRFANIMLPDSGASEPNSHGSIKFTVELKPNLPTNTQVLNRASIYFDYNLPIHTNTVTSVTPTVSGVQEAARGTALAVWPNPVQGLVRITGPMQAGARIEVQDMLGRRVHEYECTKDGEAALDVTALPAGTYMVILHTTGAAAAVKMNVVR